MTPWLDDGDVRLYHGDALETLRGLPDGSVDCVVTSPPYWGLRDYGTGEWDGGDPDCDHRVREDARIESSTLGSGKSTTGHQREGLKEQCPRCGARRVDRQMGLEPTPDLFVAGMVELFREVRRVLAPHGTCWVNLGDSYAQSGGKLEPEPLEVLQERAERKGYDVGAWGAKTKDGQGIAGRAANTAVAGLKPKDLCGIPWRVAFALQADGWYLRSDIIWAKPNPMPESVTDRPTKAHEYVFLLTKAPRYWFDSEAVREKVSENTHSRGSGIGVKNAGTEFGQGIKHNKDYAKTINGHVTGRNVRSVWQIATQPYPEAHFATFPEELARRCILAGCPVRVCRVCGKPSERIVERDREYDHTTTQPSHPDSPYAAQVAGVIRNGVYVNSTTVGWSDCGHNNWRPGTVLDPFIGSGTTAKVARDHQRHAIGIDLNEQYLELAARRLQQLSLLNEVEA